MLGSDWKSSGPLESFGKITALFDRSRQARRFWLHRIWYGSMAVVDLAGSRRYVDRRILRTKK
jgi:hypothetical protein